MKIRNKNENVRYSVYLETAIDQIEQAIDSITYSAYPELNTRTIARLREVIDNLDSISSTPIFKP